VVSEPVELPDSGSVCARSLPRRWPTRIGGRHRVHQSGDRRSGAHTASLRLRRHPALRVLERDQRRAAARPVLFPSGQSGARKGSQP
jgi:hypothetical protein